MHESSAYRSNHPNEASDKTTKTVAHISQTAKDLYETLGGSPTLQEVSDGLGITREHCRSIVNNARRDNNISWDDLGIAVGITTPERQQLLGFVRQLNSREKKIAVVHEILKMHDSRKLSRQAAHILTYAILTGQGSFDRLDLPYSRLCSREPHSVSQLLHDSTRSARVVDGVFQQLDNDLHQQYAKEVAEKPVIRRFREFARDILRLERLHLEARLFDEFLERESPPPSLAVAIGRELSTGDARRYPAEVKLNHNQQRILRQLVDEKSTGAYTTLKAAAETLKIDISTIHIALKGRKGSGGATSRLLSSFKDVPDFKSQPLLLALRNLLKERQIDLADKQIIDEALATHTERCQIPSEFQIDVGRTILERKISGQSIEIAELARTLGKSESPVRAALNGRDSDPGLRAYMNQRLMQSDLATQDEFLETWLPQSFMEIDSIASRVASFPAGTSRDRNLKRRVIGTLEARLGEWVQLPNLSAIDHTGGDSRKRELTLRERRALLTACFEGRYPSTAHLARAAGAALGYTYPLEVDSRTLQRFFSGRTEKKSHHYGAILTLLTHIEQDSALSFFLSQGSTAKVSNLSAHSVRTPLYNWATRIVDIGDNDKALKLLNRCCLHRPHQLQEICNAAMLAVQSDANYATRIFLTTLKDSLRKQPVGLLETEAVAVVKIAFDKAFQISPHLAATQALLLGASARGVQHEHLAIFFGNIFRDRNWPSGLMLIESLASLARPQKKSDNSSKLRSYARGIYTRFLEREFSALRPNQLPDKIRFSINGVLARRSEMERSQNEHEMQIQCNIESFYESYRVEAVIKHFRSYLIRYRDNRNGIPFDELVEIGENAVYEAARKYDPEEYEREGKPVMSFKSYAVNMICWNTSHAARKHRRDAEVFVASINDPLGNSDEGEFSLEHILTREQENLGQVDDLRLERIMRNLSTLSPVQRRVIELRYALESSKDDLAEIETLERIAVALHSERLTETQVSRQRIEQVLKTALRELRRASLNTSPEEWEEFLADAGEKSIPEAFIGPVQGGRLRITPQLILRNLGAGEDQDAVVSVTHLFENEDYQFEIVLHVHDESRQDLLGTYAVTTEGGRVLICERID